VAVAAVAAVWYWQSDTAGPQTKQYVTEESRNSDLIVTVTATGTVEPTNKVEISSELSATIRSVDVDDNDLVERDQVLAHLDTSKLEATVEHSKAALTAREARVAETEATLAEMGAAYDRATTLMERGISSREQFLAAKAAFERAEASLNSAKADIRVAEADLKVDQTNLDKACICSPIDGIVLQRNVEVGQIVASSLQAPVLFTIAEDLRKMEIRVDIDEADIGKVAVGNKASFTVEAYQDRTFPAVISQLRFMPEMVDGVVTYKAILSIENQDMLLRPGMTATAEIVVAEIAGALVVPNAALRFAPPVADDTGGEGPTGLLGLLFRRPPSSASVTTNDADSDGRKTLWILRDEVAVPLPVLPGSTDGIVTEVLDGDLVADQQVIIDLVAEP
jgi:HlyD family secretion protein